MSSLDAGAGDEDGDGVAVGEDLRDELGNGGLVCEVGRVDRDFTT